jgi:hypothetical protein
MQIAPYVEALLRDLETVSGSGDQAVAEAARRLSAALEPAIRLRLMEVLGEAALEINGQLQSGHVEVRLAGGDPELVFVEERGGPMPSAGDDLSARVTLRLPEALKSIIDAAAQAEGVSANTWLLQQISRGAQSKRRGPGGRRMSGYGQS